MTREPWHVLSGILAGGQDVSPSYVSYRFFRCDWLFGISTYSPRVGLWTRGCQLRAESFIFLHRYSDFGSQWITENMTISKGADNMEVRSHKLQVMRFICSFLFLRNCCWFCLTLIPFAQKIRNPRMRLTWACQLGSESVMIMIGTCWDGVLVDPIWFYQGASSCQKNTQTTQSSLSRVGVEYE